MRRAWMVVLLMALGSAGCFGSFGRGGRRADDGPVTSPGDAGMPSRPDLGNPPLELTPTPTLLAVQPAGPANDNAPRVLVAAERTASVELFSDAACTRGPLDRGRAPASGPADLEIRVEDDSETTIFARATLDGLLPSLCTPEPLLYVEDSTAPAPPALLGSTPESPARESRPEVFGEAEPGAQVRVYDDGACSRFLGTTAADDAGSFSLAVLVPEDTATRLFADATDAAGNRSACSDALVYEELDDAPLSILYPPGVALTFAEDIVIRGSTAEPDLAASVRVGGVTAESDDGFATWEVTVPLGIGQNRLAAEVLDARDIVLGQVAVVVERRQPTTLSTLHHTAVADPARDRIVLAATDQIFSFDLTSTRLQVLASETVGSGAAFTRADDLVVDPDDGTLYYVDREGFSVYALDGRGVRTLVSGPGRGVGTALSELAWVVFADDELLVQNDESTILRVSLTTGNRSAFSTLPLGFTDPVWDASRSALLGTRDVPAGLELISFSSGGVTTIISGPGIGSGPDLPSSTVLLDDNGAIRVFHDSGVFEVERATGNRTRTLDTPSLLSAVTPVAFDAAGQTLYQYPYRFDVVSGDFDVVREEVFGTGPHFLTAIAVEYDPVAGRLFVLDNARGSVIEVERDGSREVLVESDTLEAPYGLVADFAGDDLYIIAGGGRIGRYTLGSAGPRVVYEGGRRLSHEAVWDRQSGVFHLGLGNRFVALDLATEQETVLADMIEVPTGGVARRGDRFFVASGSWILDVADDGSTATRMPRIGAGTSVQVAPDGDTLWTVGAWGMTAIDIESGVRTPLPLRNGASWRADDFAVGDDDEVLWVVDAFGVQAYDTVTREMVFVSW